MVDTKTIQKYIQEEHYNALTDLFQKQINRSLEKGNIQEACLITKQGADWMNRAGQFYKAAFFLTELAKLYTKSDDPLNAGRFFYRAAQDYERVQAFTEAAETFERAAEKFYQLGEGKIVEAAKHYKLAAIAHIKSHDYELPEHQKDMTLSAEIFKEAYEKKYLKRHDYFLYLENLYSDLQTILYRNGYYKEVEDVYIKMMNATRDKLRAEKKSFFLYLWYSFWNLSSGYGEKPGRWFGTIFLFVILFAAVYWQFDLIKIGTEVTPSFYDCIYFSINMFASLGFGTYVLLTPLTKLVIMINVFFGYLMLAILLTIISRKITR